MSEAKAGTMSHHVMDSLHYHETALHHLAETACNRELTPKEIKKQHKLEFHVWGLVELLGLNVKFNHDPRGGYIRLLLPSKDHNNWDGETWGIYW